MDAADWNEPELEIDPASDKAVPTREDPDGWRTCCDMDSAIGNGGGLSIVDSPLGLSGGWRSLRLAKTNDKIHLKVTNR